MKLSYASAKHEEIFMRMSKHADRRLHQYHGARNEAVTTLVRTLCDGAAGKGRRRHRKVVLLLNVVYA